MEKVFEIYIRTTPGRLLEAITDPEIRSKYQFGNRISSDFTPGSRFEMTHSGASGPLGEGENLEVDPPRKLVQSMVALWGEDVKSEGTSRITWEIEPVGDSCQLTVTHDQLREALAPRNPSRDPHERKGRACRRSPPRPSLSIARVSGTRSFTLRPSFWSTEE